MRKNRQFGPFCTFPEVILISLLDFRSCSELINKNKEEEQSER
jgi:hypothetical protein